MTTSNTKRALAAIAVGAMALLVSGCLGPGVHPVAPLADNTAPPGLWRTLGGEGCYWERLSGYGGTFGEIIANDFSLGGPRYVEIEPTDVAFNQQGCSNFFQIWPPGPWTTPLIQQGAPFGDGDWKVNYEVAPGTYSAPGAAPGGGCYWERLSSFRHEGIESVIANDFSLGGPQIVTIANTDFGFSTDGCGTWTKIG